MTGTRLGVYEIRDKLGEGGMGEVWRARDERLHRMVAIKLIAREVAADPSRRARFEQEARALGSLNHPNIVTVFEIGSDQDRLYMATELVEGESLRALIDRGPVPPRKATDIAVQMAEGLGAAHALGIVHRDLKPENAIVRPDGQVKLLDFGLAKQNTVAASADQTATLALSQPGMVMGTAGYMAPEQVRGEPVDARADIFALGSVLYELVSGHRAFQGATAVDSLHAILNSDPPELTADPAQLPPSLAAIIRRCLEKRPEQRFQSASDLAFALRSTSGTVAAAAPAGIAARKATWPRPLLAAAAIAGAIALFAAGYFAHALWNPHAPPTFERITFRKGQVGTARFLADNRTVIYEARWEGGPDRIYLAVPGSPDARDLGLSDAHLLAVSSKDELAIEASTPGLPAGTLMRSSLTGALSRPLLDKVMAADFSPDGSSLAVLRNGGAGARLEYPLGKVVADGIKSPIGTICVSPDGNRVAYVHFFNGRSVELILVDRSGKLTSVGAISGQVQTNILSPIVWSRDGREIWFRSFDSNDPQSIYAVDLAGHKRLLANLPGRAELYDISRDGKALIAIGSMQFGILGASPGSTEERDLSVLDTGTMAGISDDGTLIASSVFGTSGGPRGSMYTRKTDGSPPVRLGDGDAYALSPDGRWVSGNVADESGGRRFVVLPTGPGEEQVLQIPGLPEPAVIGWLQNHRLLVMASAAPRKGCFVWDPGSATLTPVCPPGTAGPFLSFLSPNGKLVLTYGPEPGWWAYPVEGGSPLAVHGIQDDEYPLGWRADNASVFVRPKQVTGPVVHVNIVEIATGKRSLWKDLHPSRPVDATGDLHLHITPDGRAYAYNYSILQSDLYAATGLK